MTWICGLVHLRNASVKARHVVLSFEAVATCFPSTNLGSCGSCAISENTCRLEDGLRLLRRLRPRL
jgi:hypothetical protein